MHAFIHLFIHSPGTPHLTGKKEKNHLPLTFWDPAPLCLHPPLHQADRIQTYTDIRPSSPRHTTWVFFCFVVTIYRQITGSSRGRLRACQADRRPTSAAQRAGTGWQTAAGEGFLAQQENTREVGHQGPLVINSSTCHSGVEDFSRGKRTTIFPRGPGESLGLSSGPEATGTKPQPSEDTSWMAWGSACTRLEPLPAPSSTPMPTLWPLGTSQEPCLLGEQVTLILIHLEQAHARTHGPPQGLQGLRGTRQCCG